MKQAIYVFFVIVLLAGCSSKASDKESTDQKRISSENLAKNYIQEGVASLQKADVANAVRSFNNAIVQNPRDPQPYMILAEVYMRLKNYDYAIRSLNNVIALEPDNGSAFFYMGICYGLSGDRKAGIKQVEKSVAIFQQKRDETNFKKALITLQQMVSAEAPDGNYSP